MTAEPRSTDRSRRRTRRATVAEQAWLDAAAIGTGAPTATGTRAGRGRGRPGLRGVPRAAKVAAELALVTAGYLIYSLLRNAVPHQQTAATLRGDELLHWETAVHLDPEQTLNAALAGLHPLAVLADYYYAIAHFLIVITVGVWAARRAPAAARRLRSAFYAMNGVALAGFWLFPLAPPRLLGHGFIDTVVAFHTWGSWGSTSVDAASNQFAAMPSLHVGWALWATVTVWTLTRRRLARTVAAVYPLLTALVVLSTANHYLLDVAGGVIPLLIGLALPAGLARSRRMRGAGPPGSVRRLLRW